MPTFSIGYSVKARGINLDVFGNEQWVEHVSELAGGRLAERIVSLLDNQVAIRAICSGSSQAANGTRGRAENSWPIC